MALIPIILVLFISVFLLFFILRDFGMMTLRQKTIGACILILFGVFIGFYSYQKSQEDKRNFLLQMAFLRGEDLKCGDKIINAKGFNLITGTLSLIGKENTENKKLTFSLSDCVSSDKPSEDLQEQLEKD